MGESLREAAVPDLVPAEVGLRITLLGGFRIWVHGTEIPASAWRLQKARSIIKLLALAPDLSMHRAELIEHLWPEFDPVAGNNNLHRTLHAARRALDSAGMPGGASPTLRLRGPHVVLEPAGTIRIDVHAFMQAARDAQAEGSVRGYLGALSLYAGDLLPEDRYDDWAAGMREALRQERLSLLSGLADLYQSRNDLAAATDIRAEIVREDPFDEVAQRLLMRDLALIGQRGRALAQFHDLRLALKEIDEAPSVESEELYREILARRFPSDMDGEVRVVHHASPTSNLPAPLTSFIGRDSERSELVELLDPAHETPRLVTLTGPGGSGKTRLSLAVASQLADAYEDGIWFVDLSLISDSDDLPGTILSTLGIPESSGDLVVDVLVEALQQKSILLIWDNCEHLMGGCAKLARFVLQQAPNIRILATSRQPLGMHGEAVWRIPPLPVPSEMIRRGAIHSDDAIADLARNACVRLFCERARLVRSGFALIRENAAEVAQICRYLDGIPLAIELAAARMGMMSAHSLAERLDRSLHVLASSGVAVNERQRTLSGTLDWSYGLLSNSERALFRRLSIFSGGWTLETAEAICAGNQLDGPDILGLLAELIDKSLVQFQAASFGGRYQLLEVVRQYAAERLEESGEADGLRRRHAAYFVDLAETAEPELRGPDQTLWLDQLEREYGNIRAAIGCYVAQRELTAALRMAAAIWWFCFTRGYYAEQCERLVRMLELADTSGIEIEPAVRAKALLAAGALAWKREQLPLARTLLEESVAIRRDIGDTVGTAWSLTFLGHVAGSQGDYSLGFQCASEAIDLFRGSDHLAGMARALNALGEEARRAGDDDQAEIYYRESLQIDRQSGNRAGICLRLHNLGYVALHRKQAAQAARMFMESLRLAEELKDLDCVAACLEGIAAVESVAGPAERSMQLFGAAESLREELHVPIDVADLPEHDQYVACARTRLTRETAERARDVGLNLDPDEAVRIAINAVESAMTRGNTTDDDDEKGSPKAPRVGSNS